ncbi:hypothetical protein [Streptomyces bluensis]|uniref:hypothetical protein n=1 Tax=Streptomyces bluensis TaxID=33897 RepID=UPI0036D9189A
MGELSSPIEVVVMVLVVVFGVALLIAVLLSGLAARTVLSTSLLFLVGGALVSGGFLGWIHPYLAAFGALLTPQLFGDLSFGGYVAVVLAIVLIRPASLLLSLLGTRFTRQEKLVAAWFGPKGCASVVYGLLVLQAGIPQGEPVSRRARRRSPSSPCASPSRSSRTAPPTSPSPGSSTSTTSRAHPPVPPRRPQPGRRPTVLARDLAEPYPYVTTDEDAAVAIRLLSLHGLPALLVVDTDAAPYALVPCAHLVGRLVSDGRGHGEAPMKIAGPTVADWLPPDSPTPSMSSRKSRRSVAAGAAERGPALTRATPGAPGRRGRTSTGPRPGPGLRGGPV